MLALLIRWYGENHDPVILCDLTEVWLGEGKHTETTEMLEAFCLSGGVFGSQEFKNAARQREHRELKKQQMKILLAGNMSKYVVHIIAADS